MIIDNFYNSFGSSYYENFNSDDYRLAEPKKLVTDFSELLSKINSLRDSYNGYITLEKINDTEFYLSDDALSSKKIKLSIYLMLDFYVYYQFMYYSFYKKEGE